MREPPEILLTNLRAAIAITARQLGRQLDLQEVITACGLIVGATAADLAKSNFRAGYTDLGELFADASFEGAKRFLRETYAQDEQVSEEAELKRRGAK